MVFSTLGITKQYVWSIIPITGFCIGWFLDIKETERMTLFRDKSALYGRQLMQGERPSWP